MSHNLSVTRVVLPAAGRGSRLYPATRIVPKSMLLLGRKPIAEYILEELRGAGITDFLFIVPPKSEIIRKYFGDGSSWGVRCDYVVQPNMRGPGDAIMRGEEWVGGKPFVVALPDSIVESRGPTSRTTSSAPLLRLLEIFIRKRADAAVLGELVDYDINNHPKTLILSVAPPYLRKKSFPITSSDMTRNTTSLKALKSFIPAARWIFSSCIFDYLRDTPPGHGEEILIPDSIPLMVADGRNIWCTPLFCGEKRQDINDWSSYFLLTVHAALNDSECGGDVVRRYRDDLQ